MGATLLLPDAMTLPHVVARGHAILIEDGSIRKIIDGGDQPETATRLEGILMPGFLDLQVNGSGGRGVHELDVDALETVARSVWQGGAVAFLPTLITAPFDQLLAQLRAVATWIRTRAADRHPDTATPLGVHVEGPFLEVAGAHDPDQFVDPTPERIEALLDAAEGELRLVTLASSRPGAAEATRRLNEAGITVALGHLRTTRGFNQCVAAGARLVTHLFNAMGPLHHRETSIAGLALDNAGVGCTVITDGIHVHPSMVRNALRCLGTDRMLLVTDAVAAAGMPDGDYQLGDRKVQLRDGAVRDGQGNLAGSALSMARAAQGFLEMVPSAGPWTLARLASTNPSDYLGLEQWGRIAPGQPAHFTLMKADRSMVALRY